MLPRRYQIKLYEEGAPEGTLSEFVPVFHRWIREDVTSELLIDVADYKHVPGGPGILLVGHSSDYSVSEAGGRRGLTYTRKREVDSEFSESLTASLGKLATAAAILTEAPELSGKVRFNTRELQFTFLDRLAYPTSNQSFRVVAGAIERALERLEISDHAVMSFNASDPRQPLKVTARFEKELSLDRLRVFVSAPSAEVDA